LLGKLTYPASQQAQRDPGGLQHRLHASVLTTAHIGELRTGTEKFSVAQLGQFFPQGRIGSNQNGLELVDGLGAGFDGRHFRQLVHPGDLYRPVARFGPGTGTPAQHRSGRVLGIERIRFAAATALCLVHSVHVEHVHALGQQIPRQGGPIGTGPLPVIFFTVLQEGRWPPGPA
jgi:hypothetical protein